MDYSKLVELYDFLERTPSKLGKTEKIAEFLKQSGDLLPQAVLLIQGRVYPSYSEKETGIAGKTAIKVISTSLGLSESDIIRDFNSTGDLGLTAANLIKKKRQKTLFQKHLTIEKIFENLRKLGSEEGSGSQDRKIRLVSELIAHASPEEAKYIVRTVLEDLRIGVAEGIIRDAIAKAFLDCETQDKTREAVKAVEWAWFMRSDYSEIANIARNRGITGLKKVKPKLGVPIQPLLGEKSPGLEEALNSYDQAAIEYKYDGMRTQIHKEGDMVWLFTRRLEDVTKAFPDVAGMVKKSVKAGNCIIEGETILSRLIRHV